jgi:hypothetical protein
MLTFCKIEVSAESVLFILMYFTESTVLIDGPLGVIFETFRIWYFDDNERTAALEVTRKHLKQLATHH